MLCAAALPRPVGRAIPGILDRDGQRAAVAYSPIQTCRPDNIDPQAWLAEVAARIAGHPVSRLDEPLLWTWKPAQVALAA